MGRMIQKDKGKNGMSWRLREIPREEIALGCSQRMLPVFLRVISDVSLCPSSSREMKKTKKMMHLKMMIEMKDSMRRKMKKTKQRSRKKKWKSSEWALLH